MPIAAAVTAVVVLVLGNTRQLPVPATALATLTVLASVARTALTFREVRVAAETRAQAVTDELTGLGNRTACWTAGCSAGSPRCSARADCRRAG